jgi:hypothetical protein
MIDYILIAILTFMTCYEFRKHELRADDMECDLRILVGKHDKHNVLRRGCNKNKNNKG